MIFTKEDVSTSYDQVKSLTREYNIHYRSCIGSLIYLLSTRVDLSFAVHKLSKFSANPGKVHFEGLIHLLRYIRDMIFTKEDVSTSDEQVKSLTREYNIHYRACIGSLIYLLSTIVDLSFAVHKLSKFSANTGRYTLRDWYIC